MQGVVWACGVPVLLVSHSIGCGSGGTAVGRSGGNDLHAGRADGGGAESSSGASGGSGGSSESTGSAETGSDASLADGGSSGQGGSADSGAQSNDEGCPAGGMSPCASGLICDRYGSPTCVDPSWAEWPIPNAEVEVTAGAPNLESYTDNADGTVTDNVTELMWQQLTPPMNYTEPESLAYCASLRIAGYSDWRLPSVIELVSIVDTGTYNPSIDSTFFPGTSAVGFYWSSTQFAGDPGSMWGVYFNNGYSDYNDMSIAYSVRCVR
jgi:hypothetical protein